MNSKFVSASFVNDIDEHLLMVKRFESRYKYYQRICWVILLADMLLIMALAFAASKSQLSWSLSPLWPVVIAIGMLVPMMIIHYIDNRLACSSDELVSLSNLAIDFEAVLYRAKYSDEAKSYIANLIQRQGGRLLKSQLTQIQRDDAAGLKVANEANAAVVIVSLC